MQLAAGWCICSHFEALVAKLRKGTVSFAMYVRPSVLSFALMEQLGSHVTDFH
jgi:hypothetical protein